MPPAPKTHTHTPQVEMLRTCHQHPTRTHHTWKCLGHATSTQHTTHVKMLRNTYETAWDYLKQNYLE